jgi:hypothetical protein
MDHYHFGHFGKPDPDPDPHQSQNSGAVEAQNGALEDSGRLQ